MDIIIYIDMFEWQKNIIYDIIMWLPICYIYVCIDT